MTRIHRFHLLAGAALVAAVALSPRSAVAQSERSRVDTTFAFSKSGTVDLGAISGEIIVTGWTRPEAKVIASIERGTFEVSLSGAHISVQTRSRRTDRGRWEENQARIEVMVPIGTRVTAHTTSGDVRIKATAGEVEARSVSGDIEVLDATDRVVVHTVSGNAHLAKVRGRIRFDGTSGDLELEDATGDVDAKTVSGELTLRNVRANQLRAETTSGDVTYEGSVEGAGTFELSSHSGDVRLDLPGNTAATLNLQTYSGEISSRFPMTLQPGQIGGARRNRKMEFSINGGGARIAVQTFSGDITIERGANRPSKED